MNIQCIMHADFETPGIIQEWAQTRGYSFTINKPYNGEQCTFSEETDFLIIMGGPQSPLEIEKDPYLNDEISVIKQAILHKKLVLGFCLGAQLIGEALGALTTRSPEKEVGVFPITLTEDGKQDPLLKDFPESFNVEHWHNDMPGLTKDATVLAYSAGCPRQMIRYMPRVYGFQCHLEITKNGMQTLINACPDDLKPRKFVQSAEEILAQDFTKINDHMITILDRLVAHR